MKNFMKTVSIILPLILLAQPLTAGGMLISQTGLKKLDGSLEKTLHLEAGRKGISYAQIRIFDSTSAFRNGQRPTRQVRVSPSQLRLKPGDELDVSLSYLGNKAPTTGKCFTLVVDEAPPPLRRAKRNGEARGGVALAIRHIMKVCFG